MNIIAIINQKGGTGKTTTSVNLAAGLARAGHKTLLVDLDPQAHASVGLGLDPEALNGKTIADILLVENPSIAQVIHDTYLPDLKVAPASLKLAKVASLLHGQNFRETRLSQALEDAKGLGFAFVIIDCQPTLDVLPVNAMVAADYFLVPTQMAGYALRGLSDLLDSLTAIKKRGRDARSWDWRIVLTMVMGQTKTTNEAVDQILEGVRERVLETVIHRNEKLNQAQMAEQPRDIFEYDRRSRGAEDYDELSREILRIWPPC